MRVTRFHNTWTGSVASAGYAAFAFYYNHQRPNQALNGRTPAQVVLEQ